MPQIIIARPNGAGKSTAAPLLLRRDIAFVNADEVAKGLSALPDGKLRDMQAGRIVRRQPDDLEQRHADFAIETTLASRSLVGRVARLRTVGYRFHLFFVWLPNPEVAVARVAERVSRGGQFIPDDTVRRRYQSGLRNFFTLYRPLADVWRMYDNSRAGTPELIAKGSLQVRNVLLWNRLQEEHYDQ